MTNSDPKPADGAGGVKRCSKCRTEKPRTAFNRNRTMKDGLQARCRDCQKLETLARNQTDAERKRKRRWSRENARTLNESRAKYVNSNPQKKAAKQSVRNAVERGALVRQPCETCGNPNTHAHHYISYAEQHHLDVMWLCPAHHREWHRIHGEVGSEVA